MSTSSFGTDDEPCITNGILTRSINLRDEIERQLRLGLKLVGAVRGADRDGERVAADALDKLLGLVGIGKDHLADHVLFDATEGAELGLDGDAELMSVLDDFPGDRDVLLKVVVGTVDHHAGKAEFDRGLDRLEGIAVIEVEHDRNVRILLDGRLDQVLEVGQVRVL